MTNNLNALEHAIIDYLTRSGPSSCIAISADLDQSPIAVHKTLRNLEEQGLIRFHVLTDLREICPPSSS